METKSVYLGLLVIALTVMLGNTSPPKSTNGPTCSHKTPLKKGVPGSPGHLIQLPQREPGVTELAAIMRTMYEVMKADKAAISTGKKRPKYPDFSRISCAWPTDMATRGPAFDGLAIPTFTALKAHQKAPTKASFNALVTACVSCHRAMCPGPVAALKGLYFDSTTGKAVTPAATECEGP